jgi:competence protein ComEC
MISGCLIAGIVTGKYILTFNASVWLALFFVITAAFFHWRKRTSALNTVLLLLLIGAGACRYHLSASVLPENHIHHHLASDISAVQGMIEDAVYKSDHRDTYIFCAESLMLAGQKIPVQGKILIRTNKLSRRFTYGDRVCFFSNLQAPASKNTPGQFDYRSYLNSHDIHAILTVNPADSIRSISRNNGSYFMRRLILPVREYCRQTFTQYLPAQTASLLHALVLGEKQDLDADLSYRFQKVGVVHVLAISGLHVGFIIAFVFAALSLLRIGQQAKFILLLIILIIYIVLIRFNTPVIRASVMAILFLFGQLLERKTSVYNIIFSSLTVILLFNPRELFQPGCQFSFAAVISIVYGYDRLNKLVPLNRLLDQSRPWQKYFRNWIWIPFLVSVSAVIGTLPLSLYYYGLIPIYAIFANLIVIPLTGLIVFLSLFLLLLQPVWQIFASGLGQIIHLVDNWLELVVTSFANLPLAAVLTILPGIPQIFFLYADIFILFNYQKFKRRLWLVSLTILMVCTVFSFSAKAHRGLQVWLIDVGQGDSAFLRFPNGRTMLIDGGDTSPYWDNGARVLLPFLQAMGTLHLDYMVGSHAHNDHVGGFIYLLDNLKIDTLVLSAYPYQSILFRQLHNRATANGVVLKTVARGDQLCPDRSCRVYILHPDSQFAVAENYSGSECNNSSLVIKVQYGENAILFAGDLEIQGEPPVLDYGDFLESEILKVGHHGSLTSTSGEFLKQVNPIAAVISVGEKNKFSHPSPWTMERLRSHGTRLFLTSKQGTLHLILEPDKMTRIHR